MKSFWTLVAAVASTAALAQHQAVDVPSPRPFPGATLVDTRVVTEPLELKQATADAEAVMAGQSYVQQIYEPPPIPNAAVLVWYRDMLFAAGWKLIDVAKLDKPAVQAEDLNVSAQLRDGGRNVYTRITHEPGGRYTVNIADVGAEDWAAQLARDCRVRIHSIHFEHDRPIIQELESEPTLRKLADLIEAKTTPAVRIEGHTDNIGETGRAERQTLALGRARMVVAWLTTQGGVAASKAIPLGLGGSRPIAENDTDLGRALNRRIEVARTDCTR